MERGNLPTNVKGKRRMVNEAMSANTEMDGRDGAVSSSDEVSVMDMERRGCVVL
jgi:hypothetical protein